MVAVDEGVVWMARDPDILVRAGANLWRGREAVGGWLTLTREHLAFRAHGLNIQTAPLDMAVQDIVDIRKHRTYGFIPNGLTVTLASGIEYRFVVGKRDRFIATVQDLTA
ncbi:GRAM domain-containing protein [Dactylosporangium sp. NPDC048998]|uniref:GRAM domain-containing protein n=1 Tax=Dactylosporangium sp. NPDC048998 TaxID=3363976 RepID=UPI003716988F